MERAFYFEQLYPLQDRVLRAFDDASTEFYLGGGTAASRGHQFTASPMISIYSSTTKMSSGFGRSG